MVHAPRNSSLSQGLEILGSSIVLLPLVLILGWHDIRGRYRHSAIGPFWLTISMGVMIASIGLVFGQIFSTPMDEYLPFLAAGIILWAFITGTINEGCTGFIDAQGIIKQLPIPLFVHILRVLWRNLLILAHNILILPLVLLVMGKGLSFVALWGDYHRSGRMKRNRYTLQQIIGFLKEAEVGCLIADLCPLERFSPGKFYSWRAKFGVMGITTCMIW